MEWLQPAIALGLVVGGVLCLAYEMLFNWGKP